MGPMRAACRFATRTCRARLVDSCRACAGGTLWIAGSHRHGPRDGPRRVVGVGGQRAGQHRPCSDRCDGSGDTPDRAHRVRRRTVDSTRRSARPDLSSHRHVSARRADAASEWIAASPAYDAAGAVIVARTFFSIGGGFITEDKTASDAEKPAAKTTEIAIPFPFHTAAELLETAQAQELSISQLMLANECALAAKNADRAPDAVVRDGIARIWQRCGIA